MNQSIPDTVHDISLVIFDWAGTLIDHGSLAPVRSFIRAFEQLGIPITAEQARGPMGMAKREHIQAILAETDVAKAWSDRYGRMPGEADIDSVYEAFLPIQSACIRDFCTPIDGAVQTIETLRQQGIKIGSSTGYTAELMEVVLAQVKCHGLSVDAMLCASDFDQGRPAPWMIYENARRLGVYPMSRVAKVDDTITGVQAGRNAGCWTIGVSKTGNLIGLGAEAFAALPQREQSERLAAAHDTLIRAGAHAVVETVAEVPAVLEVMQNCRSC